MAGKFVDLNEAGQMIGVSPDDLREMRGRGEIFGYRDGASWKFKVDEVERVIRKRGVDCHTKGDSPVSKSNNDAFENLVSGLSSKILVENASEKKASEVKGDPHSVLEDDVAPPSAGSS